MYKTGPASTLNLNTLNRNLERIIIYFEFNAGMLKQEGIFRISGDAEPQLQVLSHIKQNSNASVTDLHNLKILSEKNHIKLELTHNIIGTLKKMLKELSTFTQPAIDLLLYLSSNDFNAGHFIEKLFSSPSIDEAKFIYNFLYLGLLVARYQKENKMTARNVAIILTPQLTNLTGDLSLGFNPSMQENIEKLITEALVNKSLLSKSFDCTKIDELSRKLDYFAFEEFNEDLLQTSSVHLIEMLERYPNPLVCDPQLNQNTQDNCSKLR
ncbi:MAG: hypothetical protein JSR17_05105 [Proteobacteria bacterium]|nr:hypothetical protein [Pseudomonadota bacterium]